MTRALTFRLDATIRNQGEESARDTTTVHFYHSLDQFPSPDDEPIVAKDTRKQPFRVGSTAGAFNWIRDLQQPGTHYYYACVDSVSGERDTDNNCSNVITINVRGPDLIVNSVSVDYNSRTNTVRPDGIFELRATVRNQGTDDADDSTLRYYVSSDATLSPDDTEVATQRVFSLDPNETSKTYRSLEIQVPYPSGFFYALVCVDRAVDESDTTNNCYAPIKLTVRNYAPRAEGTIPEQTLTVGAPVAVDISAYFADTNKDNLTYTVSSSDPNIATARVSGAQVTLIPHRSGSATVTVKATDPDGLDARQHISVIVSTTTEIEGLRQKLDEREAFAGLQVQNLIPAIAERYGYASDEKGVVVTQVESGSNAKKQGIVPGSLIQEMEWTPIDDLESYSRLAEQLTNEKKKQVLLYVKSPNGQDGAYVTIKVSTEVPRPELSVEIWMPDANLRAVVREALGLAPGDVLTREAMRGLRILNPLMGGAPASEQISDLTGLEHAIQLTILRLWVNKNSRCESAIGDGTTYGVISHWW